MRPVILTRFLDTRKRLLADHRVADRRISPAAARRCESREVPDEAFAPLRAEVMSCTSICGQDEECCSPPLRRP